MKKTNIFKTLVLGAAFCFAGFTANAQFEFGLSLTGGLATGAMKTEIPVSAGGIMGNSQGLMGTQYIMNNSSNMLGFAFRFGYRIPINNSEYGEVLPYVEINGFWNRPNKALRTQYDEASNNRTYPHYINVPLYIGAQYRYPVTDIIKPYAEFGIGYDLLFISSEYGKPGDDYRYDPKGALSGNVGVGCFFSDWVSLGVYYYGFGSHKIKLKDSSVIDPLPLSDVLDRNAQLSKPVTRDYGTVALRLNFHFGPRK